MKDISVETIIKNSNKEEIDIQADSHTIMMQMRGEQLGSSPNRKGSNEANDDPS